MATDRDILIYQLRQQPLSKITGIVGAKGGRKYKLDGSIIFIFDLDSWRLDDGMVQDTRLCVRKIVSEVDADFLLQKVMPKANLVILGRYLADNIFQTPQALLEVVQDEVLASDEITKLIDTLPKTRFDDFFGEFVYDDRDDSFTATKTWCLQSVELIVCDRSESAFQESAAVARALWNDMDYWNNLFYSKAAEVLLDLKNGEWNDTGQEISKEDFVESIKLISVTVRSNGGFEVWFDDGDLFGGHMILVQGSLDGGVSDVSLQG